ncbi:MAG: sialidase family protein [Crocosphaera sp.]|nr:sialidase family protein [Crocosphaera sp.]
MKKKSIVERFVVYICVCVVCLFWLVSGGIAVAQEITPENLLPGKAEVLSTVQEDLIPKRFEQPSVEQVPSTVLMPGEEDLLRELETARKAGQIKKADTIQTELDELNVIAPKLSLPDEAGLAENTDETLDMLKFWAGDVRINSSSLDVREPSMVSTPDGVLYVAVENRTNNNVGIERSTDGGRTWTHWAWMTSGNATRHPSIAYAEKSDTEKFLYVAVEGNSSSSKWVKVFRWNIVNGTWIAHTVDSSSLSEDIYPEIATDFPDYTGAHYVYVTYALRSIDYYPVFFSRSTDFGSTWSTPMNITGGSENTSLSARPDIAYDEFANDLFVTFEKPGWNGSTWEQHVWVTQSTNYGSSWGTPIQLSTVRGRSYHPRVSAAPSNSSVLVAYTRDYYNSGDLDIYYAYTKSGGTSWTKNMGLSNSSSTDEQAVEISHSEDNFHVAFVRNPEHDIRYRRTATSSLTAWTSPITINEGQKASVVHPKPALCTDPTRLVDQQASIAWTDYRDTYYDVFFDSAW